MKEAAILIIENIKLNPWSGKLYETWSAMPILWIAHENLLINDDAMRDSERRFWC